MAYYIFQERSSTRFVVCDVIGRRWSQRWTIEVRSSAPWHWWWRVHYVINHWCWLIRHSDGYSVWTRTGTVWRWLVSRRCVRTSVDCFRSISRREPVLFARSPFEQKLAFTETVELTHAQFVIRYRDTTTGASGLEQGVLRWSSRSFSRILSFTPFCSTILKPNLIRSTVKLNLLTYNCTDRHCLLSPLFTTEKLLGSHHSFWPPAMHVLSWTFMKFVFFSMANRFIFTIQVTSKWRQ